MAPARPPGEARPAPKPQPLGNIPFILLFSTTALCIMFLLWRRANSLRTVISHQLKTWTRAEGTIRLSHDEGPSSASFLDDEDVDELEAEALDESAVRARARAFDEESVLPTSEDTSRERSAGNPTGPYDEADPVWAADAGDRA